MVQVFLCASAPAATFADAALVDAQAAGCRCTGRWPCCQVSCIVRCVGGDSAAIAAIRGSCQFRGQVVAAIAGQCGSTRASAAMRVRRPARHDAPMQAMRRLGVSSVPCTLSLLAKAGRAEAAGRPVHEARAAMDAQTEKLVPQPQDAVALGLLILKAWPIRSSVKSISAPGQEIQRHRIDQHLGAVAFHHQVFVQLGIVQGEIVLEARTAAAGHRHPQRGGLRLRFSGYRRCAGRRGRKG